MKRYNHLNKIERLELEILLNKGCDISKYSDEEIQRIETWMNSLPRKVLDYNTPQEVMIKHKQLIKSFIQINRN